MRKLKSHPAIMQLHEIHETKRSIYLVCDYFKGGDIIKKKSHNLLKEHIIQKLMKSLFQGILFMKDHQIMHRDLKPDNLLLKAKDDYG